MERIVKELTLLELRQGQITIYKVTKRIPMLGISDTKLCSNKEKALIILTEWSN